MSVRRQAEHYDYWQYSDEEHAEVERLREELESERAASAGADGYAIKCKAESEDLWRENQALKAQIKRISALPEKWKGRITSDHWSLAAVELERALRGKP